VENFLARNNAGAKGQQQPIAASARAKARVTRPIQCASATIGADGAGYVFPKFVY